jgi:Antitoxin MazE-like
MSDTERVRAWRQRLKDSGLVPMTIWVPADTKARYEDLALQSHRSVSELAQHALAAYRLDPSLVAAPITDTEQLQALIRDEIDQAIAIVTATVTATVTEAVTTALPAMIETALQPYVSATVADTETATPQEPSWLSTVEAFVSDMETDTATDTDENTPPQRSSSPPGADTATDTETATPQVPRVPATGETPVADTATATAMEAGAGVPPLAREERPVADTATATETATQGEPRVSATESASVADTATVTTTDTARPHGGQRRLTPLQAAELRGKRSAGVPIKALMQEYGLSRATVHRYLQTPGA